MAAKMNLAEATAELSKKSAEKSVIMEEIQKLEDLQTEGIVGVLNGLVYSLNGLPDNSDVSITYRYFAPEAEEHTIEHSDKVVGETAKIHLTQKGGKLAITCKVVTNSTTDEGAEPQQTVAEYVAHIDVAEVPEDTELRTEVVANRVGEDVEATEAAPSAFALQLKASVDDIASSIVRKTVVMEELNRDFDQIASEIQEAKKKPAAPKTVKGKGVKKAGGKRKSTESSGSSKNRETEAGDDEGAAAKPSMLDFSNLTEKATAAVEYAFEQRAYALFPLAVALFHFYGDYASV